MDSIESRIRQLADEYLEVDGEPIGDLLELDKGFMDLGVSSMNAVAFGKVLEEEFGVRLLPERATLGELIKYLEVRI